MTTQTFRPVVHGACGHYSPQNYVPRYGGAYLECSQTIVKARRQDRPFSRILYAMSYGLHVLKVIEGTTLKWKPVHEHKMSQSRKRSRKAVEYYADQGIQLLQDTS